MKFSNSSLQENHQIPFVNLDMIAQSWSKSKACSALLKKIAISYKNVAVSFMFLLFNPLVPRVQKIKIRKLTLNRLLVVKFVKKMVYLGAHYSGRQGLMG